MHDAARSVWLCLALRNCAKLAWVSNPHSRLSVEQALTPPHHRFPAGCVEPEVTLLQPKQECVRMRVCTVTSVWCSYNARLSVAVSARSRAMTHDLLFLQKGLRARAPNNRPDRCLTGSSRQARRRARVPNAVLVTHAAFLLLGAALGSSCGVIRTPPFFKIDGSPEDQLRRHMENLIFQNTVAIHWRRVVGDSFSTWWNFHESTLVF